MVMTDESVTRVAVEMWRDPASRHLPGSAFGSAVLPLPLSSTVPELYRSGRRCFRVTEPVRLCADAPRSAVQMLVMIRELTGLGAAVAWTACCDDDCVSDRKFCHLFPPAAVEGARDSVARTWRDRYLPCMCVFRRGPGFAEVRDRRRGTLEILTLDDEDTFRPIGKLLDGVPVSEVADPARHILRETGLIAEQGGLAWWLPTRAHRWPNPAMLV
jgi:hypothetical protein